MQFSLKFLKFIDKERNPLLFGYNKKLFKNKNKNY